MKKVILVVMLIITASSSFGLGITGKKNLVGFMGGVSVNTMGYANNAEQQKGAKVGGLAGISFEHRFKHVIALELNLLYVNKGTQRKDDNAFFNGTTKLNFHSVEVPLLIKFYIGKKKRFNVYAGGFASYAFNVQMKQTGKDAVGNSVNKTENNLLSNDHNQKDINGQRPFRAYDAGVNGGFEFISKLGLGAGARFSKGLVDYSNPKYFIDDNKKVTHSGVQFYAIWKF
jgi:hypothetical protein